jgi:hypothetical protein
MHWVEVFGRERVLVVFTEELRQDPSAVLGQVYRFLGLCPYHAPYASENLRRVEVIQATLPQTALVRTAVC